MPSRSRTVSPWRRFAIRLLAVCVLGVLAGAGWLVARPPAAIQLTSYGTRVSNADPLLAQAERAMSAEVRSRHGVKASDARCYYSTVAGPEQRGRSRQRCRHGRQGRQCDRQVDQRPADRHR